MPKTSICILFLLKGVLEIIFEILFFLENLFYSCNDLTLHLFHCFFFFVSRRNSTDFKNIVSNHLNSLYHFFTTTCFNHIDRSRQRTVWYAINLILLCFQVSVFLILMGFLFVLKLFIQKVDLCS